MTSPSDPDERVDLTKQTGDPGERPGAAADEVPFDPYRFGHPDVPPAPEYAPPGYVPPAGAGAPPAQPMPPYPYGVTHSPPYGGTSPYGPPGYPPAAPGGNGRAVAGLVFGIASIVLCWTTFLDVVFIVLAVVFGSLGLSTARVRRGVGRGQAIAGLVCAAIGLVLAAAFTVFVVHVANQCGGLDNQGSPGYEQCIKDKI